MLTKSRLREKVSPFARRFRGIAHVHRLSILYLLAHLPHEVYQIVDATGLPENLVSHHLKQLYTSGWVLRTKTGRHITYKLNEKAFFELERFVAGTPFERDVLSKYKKE